MDPHDQYVSFFGGTKNRSKLVFVYAKNFLIGDHLHFLFGEHLPQLEEASPKLGGQPIFGF